MLAVSNAHCSAVGRVAQLSDPVSFQTDTNVCALCHDVCMSDYSANVQRRRYRIGIDVGLKSIGFCAIEVDGRGTPIKLLNSTVHLHDGGAEPGDRQEVSRKQKAGIARRARRRGNRNKRRLRELDAYLSEQLGWPLPDLEEFTDQHEPWHVRAELLDSYVSDTAERKEMLAIAVRHIARHRGWRNSYTSVTSLARAPYPSKALITVNERVCEALGATIDPEATQGQLASAYVADERYTLQALRGTQGLFRGRQYQSDTYHELTRILRFQRVESAQIDELMKRVFYVINPRDGVRRNMRVGCDQLPGQQSKFRAEIAHPAFQKFRIVAALANLRIRSGRQERKLSADELRRVTQYILESSIALEDIDWSDIAEQLSIERNCLTGTAKAVFEGEPALRRPPTDAVSVIVMSSKLTKLKRWWKSASEDDRGDLVKFVANSTLGEGEEFENDEVDGFLGSLTDEDLAKLEEIAFPPGRAAYSLDSLQRLTDRMLADGCDLHEARKREFGVSDSWAPKPDPIGAPVGNPAVDRVMKEVNRWLVRVVNRWGVPEAVNIEHTRSGMMSTEKARELMDSNAAKQKRIEALAQKLGAQACGSSKLNQVTKIRLLAVQRQGSKCLYCGDAISFETADMDHIVPRSGLGSTNDRNNLVAVCRACNESKRNQLFSEWVQSGGRKDKVSIDDVIERVWSWERDPGVSLKEHKAFRAAVVARLKSKTPDKEFDARSMESVGWMAVELAKRIRGFFASEYSVDDGLVPPSVGLYRGRITAAARVVSGFEGCVRLTGGNGKTRLDRRHHAMDALVIALLDDRIAQLLALRDNLRFAQLLTSGSNEWRLYLQSHTSENALMHAWSQHMQVAAKKFNVALESGMVRFTMNQRLRLGSSRAHMDSVHSFEHAYLDRDSDRKPKVDKNGVRKVKEHGEFRFLSDPLPVDLIDRAETPALWTALVKNEKFDPKLGLPADSDRTIVVHGRSIGPMDRIRFFGATSAGNWSASIAVRGGYVSISNTIHHARIYKIADEPAKYGMLRVYQVDLQRARGEDLFSFPIPACSISMRTADKAIRELLRDSPKEPSAWLVAGDELRVNPKFYDEGKIGKFFKEEGYGDVVEWRIVGFESATQVNLRPLRISEEGFNDETPQAVKDIAGRGKSWRVTIGALLEPGGVAVIRRNVLGEERWKSKDGRLPCSKVFE